MKGLTESQAKILSYITDFIKEKGYSPTFREIKTHFKLRSLGSVYSYVKTLKKKGFLHDISNTTITLKGKEESDLPLALELPFIGYLAAGFPIETFTRANTIAIPASLVHRPDETYILKAKGDTLIDEHIADGDLLLIEAKNTANEGELVVATLNHRDTIVKRFYPEGAYIRLEGSDGRHESIILHPEELQIQGIIIGLLRSLV